MSPVLLIPTEEELVCPSLWGRQGPLSENLLLPPCHKILKATTFVSQDVGTVKRNCYNLCMNVSAIALKEWAVLTDAVGRGEQLLLLRKGGIADPGGGFQLKHREFFLYPTWEHQKAEFLRPEFRPRLKEAAPPETTVPLQVYAGVACQKEVKDLSGLARLQKYHLWSEEFVRQRKAYKPELPLQALVLRAYKLRKPVLHPVRPEYAGCKSWVELSEEVSFEGADPVMDNKRFLAALEEIVSRL